jgi:hypothetical protein
VPPFFLFTFRSCALGPCSFPICHSLIFALGVITLTLTCFVSSSFWSFCARRWVVRPLFVRIFGPCSFAPPVCFGSVFGLPFLSPFSLASSGSSFPSGVVPGLSGRRLVQDFQHRPHFPPLFGLLRCFPSAPFPFVTPLLNKCPSVVLLAADWSGVSLRWSPNTLPTRHCLWP